MNKTYTKNGINILIKQKDIVLIYFSGEKCGICNIIKPKVIDMLVSYPNIEFVELETDKNLEVSAQLNIFAVPAILVFMQGRETIRQARYINIEEISDILKKCYDLLYDTQ